LQDGWYDYEAMNTALQLEMYQNGHYLVDNNGLNIFFLSLATNVTYYACSITATIIPTILPAGWTNPNSISLSGTCPQLVVNNAAWGLLTGFSVGTYPAINTATAQVNSNLIPKINPISSINVCCNMVSNSAFNSYNDVIYTFNYNNQPYGSQIPINPYFPIWYRISDSQYQNITIRFTDQSNNNVPILDSDVNIKLVIRKRN